MLMTGITKKHRGSPKGLSSRKLNPLVVDTFGGWAPEVSHVVSVISKCVAARSNESCSDVRSQVEQQLSLALTHCTAAMILAIAVCSLILCVLFHPRDVYL
jgi:hypothetical protein